MTKFSIEYNPYLVTCIFKKNGRILNDNSKIGAKSNERLQALLGESVNWKGLPEEIARACDDDAVEIAFKGRKVDYDDLEYTLNLYKGDVRFSTVFEETKNDRDVISEQDQIFEEIKEKNLPEFRKGNKEGKDIFDAYEEVKNGIFEINVIATMSSGKSTLINSLLHTELLPSEAQACTATIARILNNDGMKGYMAECYAEDYETVVYPRSVVTLENIQKYNNDKKVTYIDIEGSIPAISSDKIRLCLRDTPGTNYARNENHRRLTKSVMRRTNAVILYVLNATAMGINDDKELLKDISKEMKRAGKQSRDRFIFVISKCDELDVEKGETIDKLLNNAREYLKDFDIVDPTLIPVSARLALLVRRDHKGEKLTIKERQSLALKDIFVESELLHYEKYATLTPTVREYLQRKVDQYHANRETWDLEAVIHSGIPAVEQTICEYIDKYAYPMKIKDAVQDILGILDELNMKARFEEAIASDSNKLKRVREQILAARQKHKESEAVYENFKARVENLEIDSPNERNEQLRVEKKLGEMTKAYVGKTKVDKIEADELISDFQRRLEEFQKECEGRLNREIDFQIFQKCTGMLEEYAALVRGILEDIEIEGYDFTKISSFEKIKIFNLSDIEKRHRQIRYKEITKWKDNPERAGFWGWFKFWEPKEISYIDKVEDGVDVNVWNVIFDIMNPFGESIKNNISSTFSQSDNQIAEYKETFINNIDRLKDEITAILTELDARTKESEKLEKRVSHNRELAKWVTEKEEEIRNLLAF